MKGYCARCGTIGEIINPYIEDYEWTDIDKSSLPDILGTCACCGAEISSKIESETISPSQPALKAQMDK